MDYTATYDPETDFDRHYTVATGRAVSRWIRPGDRVLELGCATGLMTKALVDAGALVTAVDQSEPYLARLRARDLPGVEAVHADLAEGFPDRFGFDHVLATSLVHQIPDPGGFLVETAARLAPAGLLHVSVPNPRSLHRLVALELGWIDSLDTLSELGRRTQVMRMIDGEEMRGLAAGAELEIVHREGVLFKPLPNDRMAELPAEVLEGFMRVAKHAPELCAMNLFVMRRA